MNNQADPRGMHLTMAVPAAANAGVGPNAGDPLIFGVGTSPGFGLAGVAENSYTPPTTSATPTGNVGVAFEGVFFLSVLGKDDVGGSSMAFNPGDKVYARNGTLDLTTGCYYGFTLCGAKTTGIYYGNVLDAVVSGATTTVRVRLKVSGD